MTLFIIALLILWAFLALRSMKKRKAEGKSLTCGGNCAQCAARCEKRT